MERVGQHAAFRLARVSTGSPRHAQFPVGSSHACVAIPARGNGRHSRARNVRHARRCGTAIAQANARVSP
ncbi:hypothetical protein BLAT2472_50263 [Burkholderia latens]